MQPLARTCLLSFLSIALIVASVSSASAQAWCEDYPRQLGTLVNRAGHGADADLSYACFVTTWSYGLSIVDITDPAQPVLTATVATPGEASGVAVRSGIAYVADMSGGLQIVDLAGSPPATVGSVAIADAQSVAVSGSRAFVGSSVGLQEVDISDPAQPSVTGTGFTSGATGGVSVVGSRAYVADENHGLLIFDISVPGAPDLIGLATIPGVARDVEASGNYAYVAADTSGLQVVDVSDPPFSSVIGDLATPDAAVGVSIEGSYVFTASLSAGVQVVDVSSPLSPTLLTSVETPRSVLDVAASGGIAYAATEYGLLGIDPFTPPPAIVGTVTTGPRVRDVAAHGDHAYVASVDGGLEVVHVGPGGPQVVGSTSLPGVPDAVAVNGTHAFLVTSSDELQVIDVSVPTSPVLVGSLDPPGTTWLVDIACHGNGVYLVGGGSFDGEMIVVDVSDPSSPAWATSIGFWRMAGPIHVDDHHAYVKSWTGDVFSDIAIFDLSNPLSPEWKISLSGAFMDFSVDQGRLTIADMSRTVLLYDVSVPSTPVFLGEVDGPRIAGDMDAIGNYAYASTGETASGLRLWDVSGPSGPVLTGSFDTIGPTGPIAVSSRWVFLADGDSTLLVLPLQCDAAAVGVTSGGAIQSSLGIDAVAPNPFRESTTIAYRLPSAAPAGIEVYGVTGRLVRSLAAVGSGVPTRHTIRWDGRDQAGRPVAAGVYFIRLHAGESEALRRVVRIR